MNLNKKTVSELQSTSERLESIISELQTKVIDAQNELKAVRGEIAKRTRIDPEPRLTDHALLRYLERVEGIDIPAIRSGIMTDKVIAAIKAGASSITVSGAKFKIVDNNLVTIIEKQRKPKAKAGRKWKETEFA